MSDDETKTLDRCIADLHLMRALRPYRAAKAYVLVVVLPDGVSHGPWQGAAGDLMKEFTVAISKDDEDDYDVRRYRRDHYVDVFEGGNRVVNGKVVGTADPWEDVAFGIRRTVLLCRRAEVDKVLASKASAIADQVIDIAKLDLALVQRAVFESTGAKVSIDEAAEILSMPEELRSVLRKTGRGIRSVLERMRAMEVTDDTETVVGTKTDDGPRLQDLHGYGAAKDWGLELKRDLEDYKAGRISWDDVDNGLLLSGPPGCGKTTFAQALANSLGAHLVVGSYSAWIGTKDGHQGNLLRAMRDAFKEARANSPCVLLIDEIDNFPQRGSLGRADSDEWNRGVVNGLLECLDGAVERSGVIVIGATNYPGGIDTALLRPGRLDRHIEIGLPDSTAREAILQYHLQTRLDVSPIISRTEGFSGADLERVARDARRMARRKMVPISVEHIAAAMPEMYRMTREELLWTAIHELGHAVVGVVLGHRKLKRIVVKKEIFTDAAFQAAGFAHFEAQRMIRRDKHWYENEVAVMLGSIAVENHMYGSHCDGSADDLRQATEAALHMTAVAGFGGSLVSEGRGGDMTLRRHQMMSVADDILHEQLLRAATIVERYHDLIERLAEELADKGELDGEVVTRAVRDHGKPLQLALAM
jgi:cell division protease FtsH